MPRFTSPSPVNSGELVDFDGMESTVSEFESAIFGPTGPPSTTYATFKWNFGDGTPEVTGYAPGAVRNCEAPWLSPCAASIFHSYTYGGTYDVTLTVTDVGGNVVDRHTRSHRRRAPSAGPLRRGSRQLEQQLGRRIGLRLRLRTGRPAARAGRGRRDRETVAAHRPAPRCAVHYSVNEQVTGHFEVLISRTLARQLKISGTPAPPDCPPERRRSS